VLAAMPASPVAAMHEEVHHDRAKQKSDNQAITRKDMEAVFKTEQNCRDRQKYDQCGAYA
tara:strand:+ start:111 stop:290 length:180 start_codon:yes stop_codon:yes gene_type:complete